MESSASGKVARQVLTQFLELDDASTGLPTYPTQTQVAERSRKARAQVSQILTKARERWRRTPALTTVRNELAEFLTAEGGVVEVNELTQFLFTSRGSDAGEPLLRRRAAAVVRAALEAEKPSETNRFEERRSSGRFLLARSEAPFGEAALDYAEKLAGAACQMASTEPLPSPVRVLETLRAVPSSLPALRDDRLVRLAAAVAQVSVSRRLELYPKGLDALRALKLAQSALAGLSRVTPDEVRGRVRERYPEAAELPGHPALEKMLGEAGLAFTWQEAEGAYTAPPPPQIESSASLQHHETFVSPSVFVPPLETPPEVAEAQQFERRLQAAYRAPSYLVLATEPKFDNLLEAHRNLARHFPMAVFHCEREMLAALRTEAQNQRVRWEVVLRADSAPPDSHDGKNLRNLAAKAVRIVAEKLRKRKESTLAIFPGLLARYGQIGIFEDLQDSLGDRSLWILVGSDRQAASPMADGKVIPAREEEFAHHRKLFLTEQGYSYQVVDAGEE